MGSYILILVVLLFLSGFFSSSEIALFSLKDTDISSVENKNIRDKINTLLESPSKLLSTILISNNIVNILFANLMSLAIYEISGDKGVLFAVIIETAIILLFCEIIPKTLATRFNLAFSKFSSIVLDYLTNFLKPLIFITKKLTNPVINFVLNKIPISQEFLNKDEFINVLKKDKTQKIDSIEETILLNILNTHLYRLKEIMEKKDMSIFISYDVTFKKLREKFSKTNSFFLVVYKNDPDKDQQSTEKS